MATTKLTKIYTGSLDAIKTKSAQEVGALCIAVNEKLAFKGGKQILGSFSVVSKVADATEQGVLYYIPATGTKGQEGYVAAQLGYYDGTAFKKTSDDAAIEAIETRVETLENAVKTDGSAPAGTVGAAVATLNGNDETDGSVAKAVKDAKDELLGDATEDGNTLGKLEDLIEGLDDKASVKDGDKILSQDEDGISSAMSIKYVSADKKIYLYGSAEDDTHKIGEIDTTDFVKDGMLDKAEYKAGDAEHAEADGPYIVLTWNTDGEKDPMWISVKGLVDVYTGTEDEIVVTGNAISLADAVKDAIQDNADAIDVLNGDETEDGSVAKSVKDAIDALNVDEISVASKSADTGKVTLLGGIKEENGKIAAGAADAVVLEKVASTGAAEDVTTTALVVGEETVVAAGTAQSTLQALAEKVKAASEGGVLTFGEKTGDITIDTAPTADNAVTFAMDENKLTGTVTKATYTATEGVQNDTITDAGLVDGKMLKDYVTDYAIYWEELA